MGKPVCFVRGTPTTILKGTVSTLPCCQDTRFCTCCQAAHTCSVYVCVKLLDSRTYITRVFFPDPAGSCVPWRPLAYTGGMYDLSSSLTSRTRFLQRFALPARGKTRLPGTERGMPLGLSGMGSCCRAGDSQSQIECPAGTSRKHG